MSNLSGKHVSPWHEAGRQYCTAIPIFFSILICRILNYGIANALLCFQSAGLLVVPKVSESRMGVEAVPPVFVFLPLNPQSVGARDIRLVTLLFYHCW